MCYKTKMLKKGSACKKKKQIYLTEMAQNMGVAEKLSQGKEV